MAPQDLLLAADDGAGVLRHRDDFLRWPACRRCALGPRGVPCLSPSGRPHDRFGPGKPEDGPGGPSALRPNARTQVGYLDGGLRILWRHL